MFGRTRADLSEVKIGPGILRRSGGKSGSDHEAQANEYGESVSHSAQQFLLRQTRYPMSSPMAGMTCPGDWKVVEAPMGGQA